MMGEAFSYGKVVSVVPTVVDYADSYDLGMAMKTA